MSFASDLEKFAVKVDKLSDIAIRKIVIDIGTRLVMRSPVGDATAWASPPPKGYTGGRFRANWQHGFAVVPAGELDVIDKSGQASNARISASLQSSPAVGVHYLANNLPYAQRLEDGYSKQAPAGMVGLTVIEFRGIVDQVVRGLPK